MILKTLDIRGRKYDIEVTNYGTFECLIDPQTTLRDKTLESLTEKIKMATRKTSRVRVDVWRFNEDIGLEHGVATGFHAVNRNILINWDGKRGGEQFYRNGNRFLALTSEEAEIGKQLGQALLNAQAAVYQFEKSHRVDLEEKLQNVINGNTNEEEE